MRFRLTAFALCLVACGGSSFELKLTDDEVALAKDEWIASRAASLGMSLEEGKRRDALLSEEAPPHEIWDARLAKNAALIYRDVCAKCHGPDGDPPDDLDMDPEPRSWGTFGASMGFFFGGDAMRAGIFRKIRDGGEPEDGHESKMPAFGDAFAREQIWGLVFYLETL